MWSLKSLIKNSLGITKHPSLEQKNRIDIERQASKTRLFQETESEPLSRATPPNSSALPSPFLNLLFRASFWAPILPGDPVYPQRHSQSLPCFLPFPCLSLDISGSYPLSGEGLGQTGTHSQNHLYLI